MKNLGEYLRTEREKKKLSIHEIGIYLKISPKILQSIEEGEVEKLPAKTFLRGFVRSYAQYLRLDVNEVLDQFQQEMGSTHPDQTILNTSAPKQVAVAEEPSRREIEPAARAQERAKVFQEPKIESFLGNRTIGIIVAVFIISMIVMVTKIIEKYQRERIVETIEATPIIETPTTTVATDAPVAPVDASMPSTPAENSSSTASATTSPTPTSSSSPAAETTTGQATSQAVQPVAKPSTPPVVASPAPQAPAVQAAPASKPLATAPNPVKPPEVKPANKPSEVKSETKPAETKPIDTKPAEPKPTTEAAKPTEPPKRTEVIIEALNKVTIKYDLGDGSSKTVELNPDEFHTFRSKSGINMEISDAGSVNVYHDGRSLGVPGKVGKSVKLSYP